MAQSKTKTDAVETLSNEVDALRADLGALVETLKDAGLADKKAVAALSADAKDAIAAHLAEAGENLTGVAQDAAGTAQTFVKEKPVVAILAAAAAGLVLGLVTSKRS